MALSGTYLPVHPHPHEDELFSSWLIRVAKGNAPRVHTFCHTIWPHKQIWNRDVDVSGYASLAKELSKRTGISMSKIRRLSLERYEGLVFERLNPSGLTPWVLPVGVYHRIRRRPGLQWCPICLDEDETPYFRRHWRMAFTSCCIRHGIVLADRCHECGAFAIPFRKEFLSCYKCGTDLRKHPRRRAKIEAIAAEQMLNARALDGRTMLPLYKPIFSIAFFDVWHHLMNHVAYGPRSTRLRQAIARQFGGDPSPFPDQKRHELEFLSAPDRNRLMDLVCRLFPGWPWKLIAVASASRSWASFILRSRKQAPFALWDPLRQFAAGKPTHPND